MAQDKATFRELRDMLEQYGEAFKIYYKSQCGYTKYAVDSFEEAYCGHYVGNSFSEMPALEEYAAQYVDECFDLPASMAYYFDYEKFARDLSCEGYWEEGGHVFRPV